MRSLLYILVACLVGESLILSQASFAQDAKTMPRVEIKKFRFRRHNKKNFERLVIEFLDKDHGGSPRITTLPSSSGKEASIQIENVSLVGAIPESLINDSYVSKSRFLGPVSINTDGPVKGFVIRTFLKEPVGVDAFWLDRPGRLVLDVFPANSARVDGRVPESEFREIAQIRPPQESRPKEESNGIVCYPLNAAVSATVSFQSKMTSGAGQFGVEALPFGLIGGGGNNSGAEPVICFLSSSQVVAKVAFKPKSFDPNNYVQWEPRAPAGGGGSLFSMPALPAPPAPPPAIPAPPLPPAGVVPTPPLPPQGAVKGPGGVVVSNITPGRTPLGSPLVSPGEVSRLPASPPPPKLPSFGDTPPASANPAGGTAPSASSLLPPVK